MLIAGKQLRLALLLLVVIGLAWGRGHSVRDSMEDRDSNSMKVESSFRMSMPLFMRNGAAVDDSSSTKTTQPFTITTTTQTTPSTRSDGQCDTISSCLNGGTLQPNGVGSCPRCQCVPGCSGIRCETCASGSTTTVMPTQNMTWASVYQKMCLNGGTPEIATNGSYRCNCHARYQGDFCELSIICPYMYFYRDSDYNNCKNGGELVYSPFTQTCLCSCPPCYHGLECELYDSNCILSSTKANATEPTCSTLKCNDGMVVQLNETNCKCACSRSFTGEYCELRNTLYWSFECYAGTPYYDPATYTSKCACPLGHYGERCQYVPIAHRAPAMTKGNSCSTNMCLNGATLVHGSNGTCRCNCTVGFQGDFCQYRQECYSLYGLTCNNGGSPTYNPTLRSCACSCPSCYYGSNCEYYNSSCNSSSSGSVTTQSPTTTARPTCSTISCLYGMKLQSNETSCECACSVRYSGEYCDLYNTLQGYDYDECHRVGTFYYDVSSQWFKCACPPGYYGDSCYYRI